jgi:hypothetical protein
VQNASATPGWPVVKKFKDTCRWRGLFWLCLDQSTPIFRFEHWLFEKKFSKSTRSRSVHADFFRAFNTLTNFPTSDAFTSVATLNSSFVIRSKFGPISSFVRRSSFVFRRSFVVFGHQHLNIFQIALHTRTSTSEQHSSFQFYSFSSGWTLIKLILWTHLSTKNIDFFYSRTFQHLFRRLDVTLHSPLQIRRAR